MTTQTGDFRDEWLENHWVGVSGKNRHGMREGNPKPPFTYRVYVFVQAVCLTNAPPTATIFKAHKEKAPHRRGSDPLEALLRI